MPSAPGEYRAAARAVSHRWGGTCNTHTSHLARMTPLYDNRAVLRVSNPHSRRGVIAIELAHLANYKPNGLTEERHLGILALPPGLVWQRAETSIGRGGWLMETWQREWFGIRSEKIAHLCCTYPHTDRSTPASHVYRRLQLSTAYEAERQVGFNLDSERMIDGTSVRIHTERYLLVPRALRL